MIEVQATFVGTNSLGYESGKTYWIRIWSGKRPGIMESLTYNIMQEDPITIARSTRHLSEYDGGGHCPYRNIESFLQNWTNIRGGI